MEPKEEKLTWETPVIEDYDIVETTTLETGSTQSWDGQTYS